MTEQPKFLLYQEQGKTKLLTRCPKCRSAVELNPARFVFRNLEGTQGLMVIHCASCRVVSFVCVCVGCLDIVIKSLKWSGKH